MASLAKKSKPRRLKSGDVFDIQAPDGRKGFGQVVTAGDVLYVIVFSGLHKQVEDLDEIVRSEILLVGWTVDALIHHGRWTVVGNRTPLVARIPFPSYKVTISGTECVRDFAGTTQRPATADDSLLEHQTTFAPIRYQKALLAHHGIGEWLQEYERLTAKHVWRVSGG